ncbi:hypothetical protein GCM10011487_32860 [Steroidobacter agaridevorans]|uniref:Uncharacterized protein n=1 Tax=Steroidobacter agaridevorans TaxID=2695856 RepID=A0A829YFC3_9GAMM|nr:hypothetical protein [Steroidobacter agaridevorans]GFE81286.1 hypothetical protein GCM10011487_32860 [Steroidobacter agaridevorans]GFE88830.1 hypothetical protein GCM10011488_37840 [Steroidobacter agaridevorans]
MKRAIFAAGALLLPLASFAGWGQPVNVTGYYVWDNGVAYIKTSSHANPQSCSSAQYLALDTEQKNFKAIWAQIISAHAQGLTVSLFYDGCMQTVEASYPKIRAIAVPNVW